MAIRRLIAFDAGELGLFAGPALVRDNTPVDAKFSSWSLSK